MKSKLRNLTLLLFLSALVVSCSKDESNQNDDNSNASQQELTSQIAESGNWIISYFFDSDKEETSNFSGFIFQFQQNGTLLAVNGSTTVSGTWSITGSSSSSSSGSDFNIFFPVPESSNFEDLNDDWDIISITNNKIELIDVSGGNGGTDYLTFIKS